MKLLPQVPKGSVVINLPADYSGDLIHVAAAVIMTQNVYIGITISDQDKKNSKAARCADRTIITFQKTGYANRVFKLEIPQSVIDETYKIKYTSENQRDAIVANAHYNQLRILLSDRPDLNIKPVFSSTHCFLEGISKHKRLKNATLSSIYSNIADAMTKNYVASDTMQAWLDEQKAELSRANYPFFIIHARNASYHAFDNTTYDHIRTFGDVIRDNWLHTKRYPRIFVVGDCRGLKDTLEAHKIPYIHLYELDRDYTKFDDIQRICQFWRNIAQMKNCVGIIGGRSGSFDTAVFMGVKPALCWTEEDIKEPAFQRVQLMASRLMSLIPTNPTDIKSYASYGGRDEFTTTLMNTQTKMYQHYYEMFTRFLNTSEVQYRMKRSIIKGSRYNNTLQNKILFYMQPASQNSDFGPNRHGYGGVYKDESAVTKEVMSHAQTLFRDLFVDQKTSIAKNSASPDKISLD